MPIADALILVFTLNLSLGEWERSGMLGREWALYRALLPRYRRMLLVTYGGAEEAEVLSRLLTPEEAGRVRLVCNTSGQPNRGYVPSIPAAVGAAVAGCGTVVIKTNQMHGGDVAVGIAEHLRARGVRAGLVARGGYHWSRFVAHEQGAGSAAAKDAAAREAVLCTNADLVVGTTAEMVGALAVQHGLAADRMRTIPNYVVCDRRVSLAAERDSATVLYAGQLIARKRVDLLIQAFAEWVRGGHAPESARLDVVGEGVEKANLQALAEGLGVPARFTPRVGHDELAGRMRTCTVYAQASELEGHPKTVIEAMAAGAPVLVTDAPGLEFVAHEKTGLRVAADNAGLVSALASALAGLMASPQERDRLGSAGAAAARAAFGLDIITTLEVEAHRRALANGTARQVVAAASEKVPA